MFFSARQFYSFFFPLAFSDHFRSNGCHIWTHQAKTRQNQPLTFFVFSKINFFSFFFFLFLRGLQRTLPAVGANTGLTTT